MSYANVALVTDYDSGVDDRPDIGAVTQHDVFAVFDEHMPRLRAVLLRTVTTVAARACDCAAATNGVLP